MRAGARSSRGCIFRGFLRNREAARPPRPQKLPADEPLTRDRWLTSAPWDAELCDPGSALGERMQEDSSGPAT